ncbi:MAG: peptidase, partial [Mycobacterium sp.]|nr:peptidase [Mycobacterium sp.]
MSRWHPLSTTVIACAAVLVSACATTTLQGRPVSVFSDPFSVAGMAATDGPTGLRDDAAAPSREVVGTDGSEIDELGIQAVSDVEEFWASAYGDAFGGEFTPVSEVHSWDSEEFDGAFCG